MEINRVLVWGLLLLTLLGCNGNNTLPNSSNENEEKSDYISVENWESIENNDSEVYSLKIQLNRRTGKIKGSHCFVIDNGEKVDCADQDITFRGQLHNGTAKIKIKSYFNDDSLHCHFIYTNDSTILFFLDDDIGWTLFREKMEFKKIG